MPVSFLEAGRPRGVSFSGSPFFRGAPGNQTISSVPTAARPQLQRASLFASPSSATSSHNQEAKLTAPKGPSPQSPSPRAAGIYYLLVSLQRARTGQVSHHFILLRHHELFLAPFNGGKDPHAAKWSHLVTIKQARRGHGHDQKPGLSGCKAQLLHRHSAGRSLGNPPRYTDQFRTGGTRKSPHRARPLCFSNGIVHRITPSLSGNYSRTGRGFQPPRLPQLSSIWVVLVGV